MQGEAEARSTVLSKKAGKRPWVDSNVPESLSSLDLPSDTCFLGDDIMYQKSSIERIGALFIVQRTAPSTRYRSEDARDLFRTAPGAETVTGTAEGVLCSPRARAERWCERSRDAWQASEDNLRWSYMNTRPQRIVIDAQGAAWIGTKKMKEPSDASITNSAGARDVLTPPGRSGIGT